MRVQWGSIRIGTASGLGAIVLWSTTFAFARSLSEKVGSLTAAAAVYLLGAGFCFGRLVLQRRRPRPGGRFRKQYLIGCGFLFAFYTAAIFLAVGFAHTRAQLLEVMLVNYLWPSLTVVLSVPILGQRARIWLLPGTVLAIGGVMLVTMQGTEVSWRNLTGNLATNPMAYLLAFGAALSWGLYSNLTRLWAGDVHDGAVEIFMLVTGIVLLGLRMAFYEHSSWSFGAVGEATALAGVTALAYTFWDVAMRKGDVTLVAAASYFTPLLSTLVSCAYLGVVPGGQLLAGCVILICGSLLTWYSTKSS